MCPLLFQLADDDQICTKGEKKIGTSCKECSDEEEEEERMLLFWSQLTRGHIFKSVSIRLPVRNHRPTTHTPRQQSPLLSLPLLQLRCLQVPLHCQGDHYLTYRWCSIFEKLVVIVIVREDIAYCILHCYNHHFAVRVDGTNFYLQIPAHRLAKQPMH